MTERHLPLPTAFGGMTPHIIVADDDAASRRLLEVVLQRAGARVTSVGDGLAAIDRVTAGDVDLVVLDVQMPGLDGIEATRRIRARRNHGELPIILVTGHGDIDHRVAGLEAGASDFISKPYDRNELLARARAALLTRSAFDRLESVQGVLAALASAVDAKDPLTEHHCSRLAEHALRLARRAGLAGDELEAIGYGAVLHDVGKIGVPEAVIRKAGPLDEAEWAEMRRHPAIGAAIVQPLRIGRIVAPIVRGHHERWDGGGYPDGLRGEAIPIGARIVTIVDSFDAMTHTRPYRRALPLDRAYEELIANAGRQFDPALVDLFLSGQEEGVDELPPGRPVGPGPFVRGLVEEAVAPEARPAGDR